MRSAPPTPMVHADGIPLAITCSAPARISEEVTLDQVLSEYGAYGIPRIDFPEVP